MYIYIRTCTHTHTSVHTCIIVIIVIQSISVCFSMWKNENPNWPIEMQAVLKMFPSVANVIGQFGSLFFFARTTNLKSTVIILHRCAAHLLIMVTYYPVSKRLSSPQCGRQGLRRCHTYEIVAGHCRKENGMNCSQRKYLGIGLMSVMGSYMLLQW